MSTTDNGKDSSGNWLTRARRFLTEVRSEMGRVTWPTRREVYATTFVVILTAVFFGVYLWGIDVLLNSLVGWLFRTLGTA